MSSRRLVLSDSKVLSVLVLAVPLRERKDFARNKAYAYVHSTFRQWPAPDLGGAMA